MGARKALRDTGKTLLRNPSLFPVAMLLATAQAFALFLGLYIPQLYLPGLFISYFGTPFLIAGYYGYVDEARRTGNPTFSRFIHVANTRYFRLFVARVYFGVFQIGVVASVIIGLSILGIGSLSIDTTDTTASTLQTPPTELIAGATALTLGLLGVVLVPLVFMQFYDVELVVQNQTVLRAYEHSYTLVRDNMRAIAGYLTIKLLLVLGLSMPAGTVRLIAATGILTGKTAYSPLAGEPRITFYGILVAAVLLSSIALAIRLSYHVTFYESLKWQDEPREKL
jgi:hypothetical protein